MSAMLRRDTLRLAVQVLPPWPDKRDERPGPLGVRELVYWVGKTRKVYASEQWRVGYPVEGETDAVLGVCPLHRDLR